MKAVYIIAPEKVEVREIEIPILKPGTVLLQVKKVGLCGGDLNAYRGVFPLQEYPMILGHEIGAIIEKIGDPAPEELKPGMNVTVSPFENCGICSACRNNRPNACKDNKTMGVRRPGGMTQFITVPGDMIYPSERLTPKELALAEPLSVGFHAVERGRITHQDTVVVMGCGLVGLGAIASSSKRGANVIGVDIEKRKLDIARNAGSNHTINSTREDLHETLTMLTNGFGPDVIIEAVGHPSTFRAAVEEVAFTGRVVYIGYAKEPVEYDTKHFVQKELDILGSRNCLNEFPPVIEVLESGLFPVDDVISKTVSMEEVGQALEEWSKDVGAVNKIMVNID